MDEDIPEGTNKDKQKGVQALAREQLARLAICACQKHG